MAFNPEKCLKFQATGSCTLTLPASQNDGSHYYFSKDNGATWVADTISLSSGQYAYCKGTRCPSRGSYTARFTMSGSCKIVSGSIMSMMDDGAGEATELPEGEGFYMQFYKCTSLRGIHKGLFTATKLSASCYYNIFAQTYISEIPEGLLDAAEDMASGCYYGMFNKCTSITKVPTNLFRNVKTLASTCFASMFTGSYITNAPLLPDIEDVTANAYQYMFSNCIKLSSLPAGFKLGKKIGKTGCLYMFSGCTSLKTVPEDLLPATELEEGAYEYMFSGCSGLTNIPKLPAKVIPNLGYYQMFNNCTSLTKVPEEYFKATSCLGTSAFYQMFNGCSKLNEIYTYFSTWNGTDNWVKSVAATGTFYCVDKLPQTFGTSNIPTGWTVITRPTLDPEYCLKITAEEDIDISLGSGGTYEFSKDGEDWSKDTIHLAAGESCWCRGTALPAGKTFSISGKFRLDGNISSLYDGGLGAGYPNLSTSSAFKALFKNTQLTSFSPILIEGIIPTRQGGYVFNELFYGCADLEAIPEGFAMPNLAPSRGALSMFEKCTLIKEIPKSFFEKCSGIWQEAFKRAFYGCTGLVEIKSSLPQGATIGENYAFDSCFMNCSSLSKVPTNMLTPMNLPFESYYQMFCNTGLTEIPAGFLPATTLGGMCYEGMFEKCTKLRVVKEGALAVATSIDSSAFGNFFRGCSQLTEIHFPYSSWPASMGWWVYNLPAKGSFYCPKELPKQYSKDRIPEGWVVNPTGAKTASINFLTKRKVAGRVIK